MTPIRRPRLSALVLALAIAFVGTACNRSGAQPLADGAPAPGQAAPASRTCSST